MHQKEVAKIVPRRITPPIEFVVWDIKEDQPLPIILGKPFFTTSHALLDIEIGELFLHANKKQVKFNFDQSMQILENEECLSIDISTNGWEETILMLYEDE